MFVVGSGPQGQGLLPTARPQKMHKKKEKTKQSTSKPEKPAVAPSVPSAPTAAPGSSSMPSFDDFLGDDLQLTDESDDN